MVILHFDGMFRTQRTWPRHSGVMGYGWVLLDGSFVLAHGFGMFARNRDASSCISEYLALIQGLEALLDLGVGTEPVEVRGDARFVIDQMQGIAAVNAESVRHLYHRARGLAAQIPSVFWTWVPRRLNRAADILSHRAISQAGFSAGGIDPFAGGLTPILHASPNLVHLVDLRVYQPKAALRPAPRPTLWLRTPAPFLPPETLYLKQGFTAI